MLAGRNSARIIGAQRHRHALHTKGLAACNCPTSTSTSRSKSPWPESTQQSSPVTPLPYSRNRIQCRRPHEFLRGFHSTRKLDVVVPVKLADIGEGIVECEVIQWFVQPGARVEQFSPLCEVQSDKASTEISSKYDGVVKKLYYEPGEMARVGQPFVDIDTDDVGSDDATLTPPPISSTNTSDQTSTTTGPASAHLSVPVANSSSGTITGSVDHSKGQVNCDQPRRPSLAVPAVRHLSKTLGIDISQIAGTGKGGRVTKEDVLRFVSSKEESSTSSTPASPVSSQVAQHVLQQPTQAHCQQPQQEQIETTKSLSPTQQHMFKTMTRSLTIPHFLYADEVDFSELTVLRSRLNKVLASACEGGEASTEPFSAPASVVSKLSYLPFIIKAVSLALYRYPILNSRVDTSSGCKPTLIHRSLHNVGIAMDTPTGLVVPVIKDVGSRNVLSIAAELARLQKAARNAKLAPADMSGGTITVSNIGNIGGTYVSPVIVEKEVAILGVGRMRTVPAFGGADGNQVVKKQVCNFSWSADHRVVDGATMARAAEVVRKIVEEPDVMVLHLR